MNTNEIASDLSFLVWQKQQAEKSGRDVPKVKAPAERPATFDAYPTAKGAK
jgi:hypothetical protein